jgi:site-specific DNA-adenine methylase
MYRYGRGKEDEDMDQKNVEETIVEDVNMEVIKAYEDMKKSMAELTKLFAQINQTMQQNVASMQKWEKLHALQRQQEQREQRAKQRSERSIERIEPTAGQ